MLTLEDDFSWIAANAFSDMRLLAEGAIALFEDEADILSRLARDACCNGGTYIITKKYWNRTL